MIDPSKYIRYIYNRVHLENATVRAGAVSTLAKFGAMIDELKVWNLNFIFHFSEVINLLLIAHLFKLENLQPRIFVLLRRCLFDHDDEVSLSWEFHICTIVLYLYAYACIISLSFVIHVYCIFNHKPGNSNMLFLFLIFQ